MLRSIKDMLGAQVIELEQNQTIGKIVDWILNTEKKRITHFSVKGIGWKSDTLLVETADIVEYGPGMIIVKNAKALEPAKKMTGWRELSKSKYRLLGIKVETKSGKQLGVTEDALFDTVSSLLQKIYIQPTMMNFLGQPDLILSADRIISIAPQKIIVVDELVGPSGRVVTAESQV